MSVTKEQHFMVRKYQSYDFTTIYRIIKAELDYPNLNKDSLKGQISKMLSNPNYHIFVALYKGECIAIISLMESLGFIEEGYIEIVILAVKKTYQQQGIGTLLVKKSLKELSNKHFSCVIVSSNFNRKQAHSFYETMGFERTGYFFQMNKQLKEISNDF